MDGLRRAASMAMMEMTTSSSTKENAFLDAMQREVAMDQDPILQEPSRLPCG
jgi:hypothetical protein